MMPKYNAIYLHNPQEEANTTSRISDIFNKNNIKNAKIKFQLYTIC